MENLHKENSSPNKYYNHEESNYKPDDKYYQFKSKSLEYIVVDEVSQSAIQKEIDNSGFTNKSTNDYLNKKIIEKSKEKPESKGFLSSMTEGLVNFKNTLKFNIITSNKQANMKKEGYVYMHGNVFELNKNSTTSELCTNYIANNYIYFSYRSSFSEIKASNSTSYSNDCGWGCMIRAAQMILGKAILEVKKKNLMLHEKTSVNKDLILNNTLYLETILLFSDNLLEELDVLGNTDFDYYKIKKSISKSIKPTRISSLLQMEVVEPEDVDEYILKKMFPPFSIQLITLLGELYNKGAGKTFSDINCIQIFEELNQEFKPIPNFEILWTEGTLNEKEVVAKFLNIVSDTSFCDDLNNYYRYKDDLYELKTAENKEKSYSGCSFDKEVDSIPIAGAIFISVRLGIEKISSDYLPGIVKLFQLPGMIGIIGGENNKGFYYFGANSSDELLFLDPHLNQKSYKGRADLSSYFMGSFKPNYFYKIPVSKISPAFTVGFLFNNIVELRNIMETLKVYSAYSNAVFKFSSEEKKDETHKSIISVAVEDDFDLIDFEK